MLKEEDVTSIINNVIDPSLDHLTNFVPNTVMMDLMREFAKSKHLTSWSLIEKIEILKT